MCVVYADDEIKVFIDGQQVYFDVPPVMINDRVLVPMRAIFEALGAEVTWFEDTQTATGMNDAVTVSFMIGRNNMTRNNNDVQIDVPAQLINDRTMIPLRAASEPFGLDVTWDNDTSTVYMNHNGSIQAVPNGDVVYVGEANNGAGNGYGKVFDNATGAIISSGYYENFQLKHGAYYYENDDYALGDFNNNLLNGYGTYYINGGNSIEGYFVDGVAVGDAMKIYASNSVLVYEGQVDENFLPHGSGKVYTADYILQVYGEHGHLDRNVIVYDLYGNYIGSREYVDGQLYLPGTAPKLSQADQAAYMQEQTEIQNDIIALSEEYQRELKALMDYAENGDPFATDLAKSICDIYGISVSELYNGPEVDYGENVDGYAISYAKRQRQEFIDSAIQQILEGHQMLLEKQKENLDQWYEQEQESIKQRQELLKIKYGLNE